ncbi:DUF7169 domain-containing protein [Microbacterium stercoris]|uniref:Uncharacterized protein n=1 Tax=Microbacterium stercoris TaxID=2820289 RepID=A0A939QKX2_9MICO|nr:hypothetical protein [Microbacterium stercoris]MBO3664789.1 hypothetical protein [Microbacterium stercoris]
MPEFAHDHELKRAAMEHAAATLRLVDALRLAREVQYDKPIGARVETPIGIADPTGETAASGARLRVRANALTALATFETATASLEAAAESVDAAVTLHLSPYARQDAAARIV